MAVYEPIKKIFSWGGGFLVGGLIFWILNSIYLAVVFSAAFSNLEPPFIFRIGYFVVAASVIVFTFFTFVRLRVRHPNFAQGLFTATLIFILVTIVLALFFIFELIFGG